MGEIRVLTEDLANKIAAGEVVERPASVVRELVENSLDAGATRIVVEIEKAGRKLIRVSDDGRGMDEDDALLAVERHATSKIAGEPDLHNISTMGFRGEALPSIAAVSKLTLTTAREGSEHGIIFEVKGGKAGRPRPLATMGTTVEVRDLFYNTPARKKFLKRDATELMHIVDAVTRLALSHPLKGFSLIVNSEPTIDLPAASGKRERLMQVYGAEFLDGLIEASRDEGSIKVKAFVSTPSGLRENRLHQMLFINRRPVRDPSISHAVFSAYDGIAPRGLHPVFFVYLEIDPSSVDVNVHPAKREVRFAQKDGVYRFVRRVVSEAVRTVPTSGVTYEYAESTGQDVAGTGSPGAFGGGPAVAGEYPQPAPVQAGLVSERMQAAFRTELPFVYLGESFLAYPDAEGGLEVLDHHAAHERVLYERLLKGLKLDTGRLLFPRQVRLSRKEHIVVLDHLDMLRELGLEVEDFGGDTVIVRSLPAGLEEADMRGILSDTVGAILEGERPGRNLREAVAARVACHSSVRGSRMLGREELMALLDDLDRADDPEHCPHGRPTRLRFSLKELRRMFKRG